MMNFQLADIQRKVYEVGERINAPINLLIVHDRPVDDGTPFVEIGEHSFRYVSSERGYELFRKETPSANVLLYWIFERVVSRLAMEYEINNRREGEDSRRIYFSKKIQLMTELDPGWGNQISQEIDQILKSAPYVDLR